MLSTPLSPPCVPALPHSSELGRAGTGTGAAGKRRRPPTGFEILKLRFCCRNDNRIRRKTWLLNSGWKIKCINLRIFYSGPLITWPYGTIYSPHYRFLPLGFQLYKGIYMVALMSHPDFRFRVYKLFNKLIIEFILNVL